MNARNRNDFPNSSRRRGGGTAAVRQGGLILLMIGCSFLLGFFVLSRFVPARGAEGASAGVQVAGDDRALRTGHEQPAEPLPVKTQRPIQRVDDQIVHPVDTPGPSIEPEDDGQIQKPSSIDPESKRSPESRKDNQDNQDNQDGTEAKHIDTPTQAVRVVDQVGTDSPGPSDSPPQSPPRRARRRRRNRSALENSAAYSKAASDKKEVTQTPSRLDDSPVTAGDIGGNSDAGNSNK